MMRRSFPSDSLALRGFPEFAMHCCQKNNHRVSTDSGRVLTGQDEVGIAVACYLALIKLGDGDFVSWDKKDILPFGTSKTEWGNFPANFPSQFIKSAKELMTTPHGRSLGYHSRARLNPKTSGFSTLRFNHYDTCGVIR